MNSQKLYRTQMAELARMSPTQLDYFVRLGAFAPDLGDKRKYYSIYEAAMVLTAGQLMPHFKDQREICEVLTQIRNFTVVPGVEPKSYLELSKACHFEELRQYGRDIDENFFNDAVARIFFYQKGYCCAKPRTESNGMKAFCEIEGLDFNAEFQAASDMRERICSEAAGRHFSNHFELLRRLFFFDAIAGSEPQFLQVVSNGDGSVSTLLDTEPMPMPGRNSWITIDLGNVFAKLAPHIDESFVKRVSDYMKERGDS